MKSANSKVTQLAALLLSILCSFYTNADTESALAAMEVASNPLLKISTSKGDLYIELYPSDAPLNVAHFLGLAAGEIDFTDQNTGTLYRPRYYDGMTFHRVIPEFIIQAGSPFLNPLGAPEGLLKDEINATALGLDSATVLLPNASVNPLLNITSAADFSTLVLFPLYQSMGIETPEHVFSRQQEIADRLHSMSIKQLYQLQGYSYSEQLGGRPIERGTLALANQGPNTNSSEFFLSLGNSAHLQGKYTAIGNVVEGLEVMDAIGERPILATQTSRSSTIIYSIRKVN